VLTQSPKEKLRDIYTRFGICSQLAQNLETLIVAVLKLVARSKKPDITTTELAELDAELSAHTMGYLLSELRQKATVDHELEALLNKALKVRNRLAHRWFGENATNLMSQPGRSTCLVELSQTKKFLNQALNSLLPVVHEYFNKIGWSFADVERALSVVMQAEVPDGPDFSV